MPCLALSSSVSSVPPVRPGGAGLKACEQGLATETHWKPRMIHHAACIRFSAYDFFRKLALKYIAQRRGKHVKTSEDYDYTDYEMLGRFVDSFAAEAALEPAA